MPHLRLEYSANIQEKETLPHLFESIHHMLAEKLPCKLLSCKSRATENKIFFLGDGKTPTAFVHIELKTTKGRTPETLKNVGENLLELAHHHFAKTAQSLDLEITLEIIELQDTYFSPWMMKVKS